MNAPFMQLYVGDYLKDTRHLTAEQHGAYLLLLMSMWAHGGELPNDPKKLARLASCTPARWAKIADDVLEFFEVDGAVITQSRLRAELKKALEKSIIRAKAGMRGGEAKSLKYKEAALANAMPLPCHSSEPEPDTTEAKAPVVISPKPKARGSRFVPSEWQPLPSHFDAADAKGLSPGDLERALAVFRNHEFPRPYSDWNRCFTKWLAREKPQNVHRPDRHTAQLDHFAAIHRAMGGTDRAEPERCDFAGPRRSGRNASVAFRSLRRWRPRRERPRRAPCCNRWSWCSGWGFRPHPARSGMPTTRR